MVSQNETTGRLAGLWRVIDRLSSIAMLAASTTIVVAAVSLLWFGRAGAEEPIPDGGDVIEDGNPAGPAITSVGTTIKGNPHAKLAIVEFSDFECPYCAQFATGTHARLDQEFVDTGKIRYAFRNVPIEQIHPQAVAAAVAAECAGLQGRFWQMYALIFANQDQLGPSAFLAHSADLGLVRAEFTSCMAGQVAAKIAADRAEADRLGIHSTPTFLVGELRREQEMVVLKTIRGAQPFDVFKTAIEEAEQLIAR